MKILFCLGMWLFLNVFIIFQCESQELNTEQEIFCKYLVKALKDKKVKNWIFPTPANYNSAHTPKDIYILSEKTPFCCDKIYDISYNQRSLHFYLKSDLFFYAIRCSVWVDTLHIGPDSGFLKVTIPGCHEEDFTNHLNGSFQFQLKNGNWKLTKKEISISAISNQIH